MTTIKLSKREQQILERIWQGKNTKEIALEFGVSNHNLGYQKIRMYAKTGVGDVVGLVRWGLENGLIKLDIRYVKGG